MWWGRDRGWAGGGSRVCSVHDTCRGTRWAAVHRRVVGRASGQFHVLPACPGCSCCSALWFPCGQSYTTPSASRTSTPFDAHSTVRGQAGLAVWWGYGGLCRTGTGSRLSEEAELRLCPVWGCRPGALCSLWGGGWEPAARALHPPSAAQAAGAQGQKRERPRHVLRLKCHLLCNQGRSRKTGSRKSGPASVLGLRAAHSRPHRPSASTPAWSSPALSASLSALSLRKGSLSHLRVSVEVGGSAASAPRRPRPARGILAPGMALHWHQRGLAARLQ